MNKKFSIYVVWGEEIDKETEPSYYSFDTQGELDAFFLGINEASGWLDARTFETNEEATQYIREEAT